MCMPPSPPTQPVVMAVSDTELALSWQQGESEGSAPVLHFLVAYIRSVVHDWSDFRKEINEALHLLTPHLKTSPRCRQYTETLQHAHSENTQVTHIQTIKPAYGHLSGEGQPEVVTSWRERSGLSEKPCFISGCVGKRKRLSGFISFLFILLIDKPSVWKLGEEDDSESFFPEHCSHVSLITTHTTWSTITNICFGSKQWSSPKF